MENSYVTWVLGQQLWNGLVMSMAYSLFALGLTLIFGVMRVINLAHGYLFMLGAMTLWTLTSVLHINFFLAIPISIVFIGIIGLIFYYVSIKPLLGEDPLITMLSTMAVGFILQRGATIIWNIDARNIVTPFKGTYQILGLGITQSSLAFGFLGVVVLIAMQFFLTRTIIGKAMRATAADKVGAGVVGINVKWIYGFTMVLCSALAAISGIILGSIWTANPGMSDDILLKGFAIVVIGGMGNLTGCIITAFLLGTSEALFSQYVSMHLRDIWAFGALVCVLLIRPQGLFVRK
jgi:branched-chain amino acid transport system permease protein